MTVVASLSAADVPRRVDQMQMIKAIIEELDRQGVKEMHPRHFNVVIDAANAIQKSFDEPYRESQPAAGIDNWLASDDVGASSLFMASILGNIGDKPYALPLDIHDVNRCMKLLDAVPEFQSRLRKMSEVSNAWGYLVGKWNDLVWYVNRGEASAVDSVLKRAHSMEGRRS